MRKILLPILLAFCFVSFAEASGRQAVVVRQSRFPIVQRQRVVVRQPIVQRQVILQQRQAVILPQVQYYSAPQAVILPQVQYYSAPAVVLPQCFGY